ncbi:MAG: carboxypeptidase regulatory-like domain-containing protein [Bryobacterales bacterium]|nr:carboxypeptidase regulatory-like domain-containing protein [Bryobacterales bacterium]
MLTPRLLLLTLFVPAWLSAQVNAGALSGTVQDPAGAIVPSAKVTLQSEQTGVEQVVNTSGAGVYLFPTLQPGTYRVSVEAPGFKRATRAGIVIQVGEKLGVDFRLEVGAVTETMNVTAESPLLTTTNANIGQVVDQKKIMELPLPGRDTIRLVQLAPGVGGINSNLGDLRFGGGRIRQAEFYVDGSPTSAAGDARATALPSIDAIQEFRVETNNLSAEYGRLSGGAINIQTRAGTNELHGSLYDFARDDVFNANSWDGNRRGSPRGTFTLHQFGGTIGGPMLVPKLYNGRNRTFFFFNYDAERRYNDGALAFATMPTAAERTGDFSQTLNNNGQRVTIYDPSTYNAASNSRQPFAGNRIPESRFDPAARYMLSLWPAANRQGDPLNGLNNFGAVNSSQSRRDDFTGRFDHNINPNHRIYLRVTRKYFKDQPAYWAGPATSGVRNTWQYETGSTLNYTGTITPTTILTAQFGATARNFTYYPLFNGFDPTQVPFAGNARRELDPRFVPNMSFERVSALGVNFLTTWLRERYFIGTASVTKIWNRHTLKAGYEIRPTYLNNIEPGAPSGRAAFDGAWTGLNQQAPFAQQGAGLASFMLGLPNNFSFDSGQLGWALSFRNHAWYVQDDFRVNSKLTLNLGLRWDYEAPMTERFNRLAVIDFDSESGVRSNANWNFQRDVLGTGQLPAGVPSPVIAGPFRGGMGVVGTPAFPGRGGSQRVYNNFGPRLGMAYQLRPTTVLRAGFGIIYAGYTGNASGSDSLSVQRFFRTTGTSLITLDNGRTNFATLTNPFPNDAGLIRATNDPAEILRRYQGNSGFAYQYNQRPSYEISYNAGIQQQIGKWAVEASFIGNRGLRLYIDGNVWLNPIDMQFLSLGATLERPVANPFAGAGNAENGNALTAASIPYKQLLRPMPHLVGDTRILRAPIGQSTYLAGYFRAERRYSNGLSVLFAYTASKLIENTPGKAGSAYGLPQDGRTFSDIRGLSVQDIPQKLVATYLYDLPFGKGKKWANNVTGGAGKVLDAVIGGWAVSGFTIIQSGYPLQITQNDNYTGGMGLGRLRPTLVSDQIRTSVSVKDSVGFANQARGAYLNRAAFAVTNRYGVGNVPATLPNLRQPRFNVTDLAVMKNFRFKERMQLQVRLESQNAFNHPVFNLGGNDLNIQSATFGYMNSVISQPRNMQFGARFVF